MYVHTFIEMKHTCIGTTVGTTCLVIMVQATTTVACRFLDTVKLIVHGKVMYYSLDTLIIIIGTTSQQLKPL